MAEVDFRYSTRTSIRVSGADLAPKALKSSQGIRASHREIYTLLRARDATDARELMRQIRAQRVAEAGAAVAGEAVGAACCRAVWAVEGHKCACRVGTRTIREHQLVISTEGRNDVVN
ncbi:MAG TPA: hypothetical protein VM325_08250 [Alphaproteobacteria bacterium]|nr:hypothetical protein [Alphaproteobacteria bacterium]